MLSILADNNDEGHVNLLLQVLQRTPWREVWADAAVAVHTFETLSLPRDASDVVLWETCQQYNVVLITANRNRDGDDSLEATIQHHNEPGNLPVFTLANPERILRDRTYAELVAARLLERLLDIDHYRGVGRIFLP